jgi:tetratricopeptide (TPR) repeat protein
VLSGCSASTPKKFNSKFYDPNNAEMAHYSDALHGFIIGSLYGNAGDYKNAITYLSKTNNLLGEDASPSMMEELGQVLLIAGDGQASLKLIEKAVRKNKKLVNYSTRYDLELLYAGLLCARGDLDQALKIYKNVPINSMQGFEAAYLAAEIYASLRKPEESKRIFINFTTRKPSNEYGFYFLGNYQEVLGDLKGARKSYIKSSKLNFKERSPKLGLGRVALKLKDLKEARKIYSEILKENPEDLEVNSILAGLGGDDIDLDKLKSLLQESDRELVDLNESRFQLSELLLAQGRIQRAVDELYLGLISNAQFDKGRYRIALIYSKLGAHRDAVRELLRIGEDSPLFVKSRVFASVLDRQRKRDFSAESHIREALKKERDNLQILIYLVSILRDAGRYSEAETVIQNALESNPESVNLIFDYAMLLHVMKREKEAQRLMEKLLKIDPNRHDVLNYLAYSFTNEPTSPEKLAQGYAMIQKAIKTDPNNAYYLDTFGWIRYNQGEYAEAVAAFERAVQTTPGDGLVFEHYGDALVKVNKNTLAYQAYLKALGAFEVQRDTGILTDSGALQRIARKLRSFKQYEKSATVKNLLSGSSSQEVTEDLR